MKGKKIIITGATGHIGQALVKALAGPGNQIVIHCNRSIREAEGLKMEAEARGAKAFVIPFDLSRIENVESLVSESVQTMDGLDILIHTAAVFEKTPLGTVTEEQWDAIIDLDLKAAFFLAQSAGISMQGGGGSIILISDVAAKRPYAGYLPYCIAKAGVDAIVKGLAKALAPKVLVNGIAPYIVTRPDGLSDRGWNDMLDKMPLHRETAPEEIASVAEMLCGEKTSITGQIVTVDGGRTLK